MGWQEASLWLLMAVCCIYPRMAPDNEVALVAFLCASISVFLVFNLKVKGKSKIFMGDAGNMFLGCSVAIAVIYFSQSGRDIINPATALWLFSIPMMDMASTMLRRMQKGQSPVHADRTHLHHILMRGSLSQHPALLCIVAASIICELLGVFLERVWPQNEAISFILWLGTFGLYCKLVVKHAFQFAKRTRRKSGIVRPLKTRPLMPVRLAPWE